MRREKERKRKEERGSNRERNSDYFIIFINIPERGG